MKTSIILAASLALSSYSFSQEIRTFKNQEGRAIKAQLVSSSGDDVILMLSNGKEAKIKLATLSQADQEYVKNQNDVDSPNHKPVAATQSEASQKINEAIGHPAFNDTPFTQRKAAEFAKSLQMPIESKSSIGNSWRLYAAARKKSYRLFNSVPYSVALYSDEKGNARAMSFVFANKGDYDSKVGFGANHFKKDTSKKSSKVSLKDAMEYDYETIKAALTQALGNGKKDYYGDSGTRNGVLRWDWNDHSFILSLVKGEYVSINIVPVAKADREGRSKTINDAAVKERIQHAIAKDENGDVYLTDIPMVDQGPKGYCVPATFERAMRFMGLEADMYLLAMLGKTKAGGGTSVRSIVTEIQSLVRRKGARVKEEEVKKLSVRYVKSKIDKGIPILWTMSSGEHYSAPTNANTKLRKEGDRAAHLVWLAEQEEAYSKKKKPETNHVCMIIGYNEETNELAVSDSWGERFNIRWTPLSVANWVNYGQLITIQP